MKEAEFEKIRMAQARGLFNFGAHNPFSVVDVDSFAAAAMSISAHHDTDTTTQHSTDDEEDVVGGDEDDRDDEIELGGSIGSGMEQTTDRDQVTSRMK